MGGIEEVWSPVGGHVNGIGNSGLEDQMAKLRLWYVRSRIHFNQKPEKEDAQLLGVWIVVPWTDVSRREPGM